MTRDEVMNRLAEFKKGRIRITYSDGVVESVDIHSIDEDGILHSGPDGKEPARWWTHFGYIKAIDSVENT